ncbi:MAG: DJ-1/PfpI family protein [Nannocystaceae bacterium]
MTRARPPARPRPPLRRIAVVGFPGAQILDVVGPLAVFGDVARWSRERGDPLPVRYEVVLLAPAAGPFTTSCGVRLVADRALAAVRGRVDTLLIAGGPGTAAFADDPAHVAWVRRIAPRVGRIASICTGAFVLAAAGLLDGRRATTHWQSAARLQGQYPQVRVDADPIYIKDGNVYTSAGVTSGMDLSLALVEEECGREVALAAARALVLFLHRPGGQSQFSAQLAVQSASRGPIADLVGWIADHLRADLSVAGLAARAGMSPRNFARVFARELGVTPARHVERVRVEAARRRLEESNDDQEAVADAVGFASAEVMRRAFLRTIKVAPGAYRGRFRGTSTRSSRTT